MQAPLRRPAEPHRTTPLLTAFCQEGWREVTLLTFECQEADRWDNGLGLRFRRAHPHPLTTVHEPQPDQIARDLERLRRPHPQARTIDVTTDDGARDDAAAQ